MRKSNSIKLDDLKWEPAKIIGPPFRIFVEGDKIVGVSFGKEPTKSVKKPTKHKRSVFEVFVKSTGGKFRIKLV